MDSKLLIKTKLLFDITAEGVELNKGDVVFIGLTYNKQDKLFFVNIFKDINVKIPIIRLSYSKVKDIIIDFPTMKVKDKNILVESKLFSTKVKTSFTTQSNKNESLLDIIMSTLKVTTRRWKSGNFNFIQLQLPSMSHIQFKLTDKDYDKLVKLVSFQDLKDTNAF